MKPARERGFALLIVLWSLVLLALLLSQLLAAAHTALALADNLRNAAAARAEADGAINEAVFHLTASGNGQWAPDGALHRLGSGAVTVRIKSLAGKINPNLASTGLLAGLLQASGVSPAPARQLANAIIQWRSPAITAQAAAALQASYRRAGLTYGPPGRPFSDLSELGNVIGMKPAWLAQILPHLSLYQTIDPDPALSDAIVRRALVLSGQPGSSSTVYEGNAPTVTIEAMAQGPGHTVSRRTAIISLGGVAASAPFELLSLTDTQ